MLDFFGISASIRPCGHIIKARQFDRGEGKETVALGKTGAKGTVRRYDVARVAMALLENEGVGSCWLDLLEGKEEVEDAVERCVGKQVDCADGENVKGVAREQQ